MYVHSLNMILFLPSGCVQITNAYILYSHYTIPLNVLCLKHLSRFMFVVFTMSFVQVLCPQSCILIQKSEIKLVLIIELNRSYRNHVISKYKKNQSALN